jgi:phospholipid transport system substrate-binding protein
MSDKGLSAHRAGSPRRDRGFLVALAVIAGLAAVPRPAAADEVPATFIRAVGDQALAVIRSDLPLPRKAAYFRQMIHRDFDLTGICRFVLGPYWRIASQAEQGQFCDGFADSMIRFYGQRLAQMGGGDFSVTGSRADPDGVVVASRIMPRSGSPISLDWRLGVSDGHYKIEDVAVDGVSMALAQRSEVTARIARDGGQLGPTLSSIGGRG